MIPLAFDGSVNELALAVFALVLAVTLAITYWASKRTRTATEFWAAGRGITGLQNGLRWRATTCPPPRSLAFPG
jgi:cation/acetate symporter